VVTHVLHKTKEKNSMGKDLTKVGKIIFMCSGYTCQKRGGDGGILALRKRIEAEALQEQVHTIKTLCTGQCESGPIMFVYPDGVWYQQIDRVRAEKIISCHIMQGELLEGLLYTHGTPEMQPVSIAAENVKDVSQ
jgi:(2Fe-2S) ferredoxin